MHVELRVTGKKLRWLFCLKAAWIIAAVVVLLIGLGGCLVGETPCFQAGQSMEGFMFILSFPSCILFLVWYPVIYGWASIHSPVDYVLFWLGAFVVGYVQWFVLIPRLFATPVLTSLNLVRGARSKRSSRRRRRKQPVRTLAADELKPFDAEGKTPIERVFSARS
jgi:hypothetical protein